MGTPPGAIAAPHCNAANRDRAWPSPGRKSSKLWAHRLELEFIRERSKQSR
jgi:hypothetical protein